MMSLCYVWGWQPPQTASCIPFRHLQSVWAHWGAVHWHMVAASHSYTHPSWLRFCGSWSLVESTWCNYIVVEANSHLKLLLASISDITKGLSTLICCPLAYGSSLTQYTHPTWLRFWGLGSLAESKWWSCVKADADSHIKLLPAFILDMYKVFEHIDMLSIGIR
jgi:hypothetical protein